MALTLAFGLAGTLAALRQRPWRSCATNKSQFP
jgi:hypothetical protein